MEPSLHYADYTVWQDQTFSEDALKPLVAYWKDQLRGLPDLPLPGRVSAAVTFRGARQPIMLPVALGETLKKLSGRANATLFMTLLAAFETLLAHYSQQRDLAIFIPLSGRQYAGLEGIMGLLASAVPIRTQLENAESFVQIIQRVRSAVLDASAHQGLSLRRLLLMMQAASPGRQGEVLFAFDALSRPLPLHWHVETEIDLGTAKLDLYLHLTEHADGIRGSFEYSADLFDPQTIRKMSDDYLRVLQLVATDPNLSLSEIHQWL
jgi:non-ribosomal peptide synthetase component F